MTDIDPYAGIDRDDLHAIRDALHRLKARGFARDPNDVEIYAGEDAWRRLNGDYWDIQENPTVTLDGIPVLKYFNNGFPDDRALLVDTAAISDTTNLQRFTNDSTIEVPAVLFAEPSAVEFVPEFEVV